MSDNTDVASLLREAADLLEEQGANPFRIRAYRDGAATVEGLDDPIADIYASGGTDALERLPAIGAGLAGAIAEYLDTGRMGVLERLRGRVDPVAQLASIPGIGEILARRVHDELGVESLAELETAAHDGRLARVEGFGPDRIETVMSVLAARLRRRTGPTRGLQPPGPQEAPTERAGPPVSELLDVDREYREKARAGQLRTIAPRRFNPEGVAWLPILHTERDGREYTALFSNTARAHELGRTRDWVVIYVSDGGREDQFTVITARRGQLEGRRVVRGREAETERHYRESDESDEAAPS